MAKKEEKKTEKEKEGKGSVVSVYDKNGKVLRVMDKKQYGKDFRKLAKELASKENGRVVKEGRPKGEKDSEEKPEEEGEDK